MCRNLTFDFLLILRRYTSNIMLSNVYAHDCPFVLYYEIFAKILQ